MDNLRTNFGFQAVFPFWETMFTRFLNYDIYWSQVTFYSHKKWQITYSELPKCQIQMPATITSRDILFKSFSDVHFLWLLTSLENCTVGIMSSQWTNYTTILKFKHHSLHEILCWEAKAYTVCMHTHTCNHFAKIPLAFGDPKALTKDTIAIQPWSPYYHLFQTLNQTSGY